MAREQFAEVSDHDLLLDLALAERQEVAALNQATSAAFALYQAAVARQEEIEAEFSARIAERVERRASVRRGFLDRVLGRRA